MLNPLHTREESSIKVHQAQEMSKLAGCIWLWKVIHSLDFSAKRCYALRVKVVSKGVDAGQTELAFSAIDYYTVLPAVLKELL